MYNTPKLHITYGNCTPPYGG